MAQVLTTEKTLQEWSRSVSRESTFLRVLNIIEWPSAGAAIVLGGINYWKDDSWGLLVFGGLLLMLAIGHRLQLKENTEQAGSLRAGQYGENRVSKVLSRNLPGSMYIINDITIKFGGTSAQIDHLVIGPKGIFVIETKNWRGTVKGNEKREDWQQIRTGGKGTVKVGNPISQNQRHVDVLHNYLRAKGMLWKEMYSVVTILSPRTKLVVQNQSTPILPPKTTARFIDRFQVSTTRSPQEVRAMVDLLLGG